MLNYLSRNLVPLIVVLLIAFSTAAMWIDDPATLCRQGRAILNSDPSKAEELFDQSIYQAGGRYPEAELLRVRTLAKRVRWREAVALFASIEDLEECQASDLILLAEDARNAGILELADRALQSAIRSGSLLPDAVRDAIRVKLQLGDSAAALGLCGQLTELSPSDPFPWLAMASVYESQREFNSAVHPYEMAIQLEHSATRRNELAASLFSVLVNAGDAKTARQVFKSLPPASSTQPKVILSESYLFRLEGNIPQAMDRLDQLLDLSPKHTGALMLRGIIRLDNFDHQGAIVDFSQVVAAEPLNKEAHYKLSRAYHIVGNSKQAEYHLGKSQALTKASIRLMELERLTRETPHDAKLREELHSLRKLVTPPAN